ncbi:RNA polymerase II elongation factor ELL3 isoform X2 [Myotis myotis]|uniref:RNA polymerase II elongation factor ELL3 isoform X2 n=1 Tax=Myotis myotis TaxID=51298 RepID=UPI00174CD107|nr:RNA polymerase II elongation factor ELL3 isoform X2 [Myotis myotis]
MAGPQEFLGGKLRLCFTPAARTSLLLLRLNDAALRALHECQRQQVRPVIAFQGSRGVRRDRGCVRGEQTGLRAGDGDGHGLRKFLRTEPEAGEGAAGVAAPGGCGWRLCPLGLLGPRAQLHLAANESPGTPLRAQAGSGRKGTGRRGQGWLLGLTVSFHSQYLRLPGPGCSCLFSFTVSQCGQDGPGGGLDLVYQRLGRPGPNRLHCLGPLRERLSIWAAMDSLPAPSSGQGHNLTDDSRDPENWHIRDYSRDAVSQPQMALEEKRPAPAATIKLKEKRLRTLAPSPLQGLPTQDLREGEDWEQENKHEDMGPRLEHSPSVQADSESPSPEEVPDYVLQYGAIHTAEQQHAYEQDFERDYAEYRILHARFGAASQRFIELGAEIKRVQRGTPEHKVLEEKIVQEYKKFRKRYPGYREEKCRCEYLHQKLSHIKGLILEFEEKNRGS